MYEAVSIMLKGGNMISEIPESIGKLLNLKKLNLNFNRIQSLPTSFAMLGSLEILLLAANRIREIPRQLGEEVDVKGEYELLRQKQTSTSILGAVRDNFTSVSRAHLTSSLSSK